jgi:hypothetical protein
MQRYVKEKGKKTNQIPAITWWKLKLTPSGHPAEGAGFVWQVKAVLVNPEVVRLSSVVPEEEVVGLSRLSVGVRRCRIEP